MERVFLFSFSLLSHRTVAIFHRWNWICRTFDRFGLSNLSYRMTESATQWRFRPWKSFEINVDRVVYPITANKLIVFSLWNVFTFRFPIKYGTYLIFSQPSIKKRKRGPINNYRDSGCANIQRQGRISEKRNSSPTVFDALYRSSHETINQACAFEKEHSGDRALEFYS